MLGVLLRLVVQACPVTVALALALAWVLGVSSNVPVAVPVLVTVPLTVATFVNVALAPGANGPKLPISPNWSSLTEPDTLKELLLFVTTYV